MSDCDCSHTVLITGRRCWNCEPTNDALRVAELRIAAYSDLSPEHGRVLYAELTTARAENEALRKDRDELFHENVDTTMTLNRLRAQLDAARKVVEAARNILYCQLGGHLNPNAAAIGCLDQLREALAGLEGK